MKNKQVLHSVEFDAITFREEVSNNNLEFTKKWVVFADIETRTDALGDAAYYGHLECVKLLVDYIDPCEKKSWALMAACVGYETHGNLACFEFLSPLSNSEEALEQWINIYGTGENILLSQKKAREQKQTIVDHLPLHFASPGQKGKKM